jgi:hypothetical protein
MKQLSPKLKLIFLKTGSLFLLASIATGFSPAFAEQLPSTVIPVDRNNIWQEVFKSEQKYVFMAFTRPHSEKSDCPKKPEAEKSEKVEKIEKDCPTGATHNKETKESKEPQAEHAAAKPLHETLNKLAHQHAGKVKFVKLDIGQSPLITREFRKLLRVDSETFVCVVLRNGTNISGKALPGEPGEEAVQQLIDDVTNNKIPLTKPSLMQSIRLKLFLEYLWNQNGILDQTASTLRDIAMPPKAKPKQ